MNMLRRQKRVADLLEMEIDGRSDRYRIHFVTGEELMVTIEPASNPKFLGGCSRPIRERITNRR